MTHYGINLALVTALALFTGLTRDIDGVTTVATSWWLCDLLTLAYLAAVVGVSCVTFRLIEWPARSWFNQRVEPVPAAW